MCLHPEPASAEGFGKCCLVLPWRCAHKVDLWGTVSVIVMRLFVCCHGDGSDGRHAYTK